MYQNGEGVEQDGNKALEWYQFEQNDGECEM